MIEAMKKKVVEMHRAKINVGGRELEELNRHSENLVKGTDKLVEVTKCLK